MKMTKVKIQTLLEKGFDSRSIWWEEHIKDYVDEIFQGEANFSSEYIVVFKRNGELWGFEDWLNSEGENGISEEYNYNKNARIEIFPVKEVTIQSYQRAD